MAEYYAHSLEGRPRKEWQKPATAVNAFLKCPPAVRIEMDGLKLVSFLPVEDNNEHKYGKAKNELPI